MEREKRQIPNNQTASSPIQIQIQIQMKLTCSVVSSAWSIAALITQKQVQNITQFHQFEYLQMEKPDQAPQPTTQIHFTFIEWKKKRE